MREEKSNVTVNRWSHRKLKELVLSLDPRTYALRSNHQWLCLLAFRNSISVFNSYLTRIRIGKFIFSQMHCTTWGLFASKNNKGYQMSFLIRWWCWWPKWTVSIQKKAGTSPLFSRYDETFLSVTQRWFISWTVLRESKDKIFGTGAAPRPLCSGGGGVEAISEPIFPFSYLLDFLFSWLTFWTFLGDKWKWGPCSTSSLQQFHDRYLEYLMFAREKELDPDFPFESKRLESLTYEERKAIIEVNGYYSLARYLSYSSNRYFLITL